MTPELVSDIHRVYKLEGLGDMLNISFKDSGGKMHLEHSRHPINNAKTPKLTYNLVFAIRKGLEVHIFLWCSF